MVVAIFTVSLILFTAAAIFIPAGRVDYAQGWICLIALVVGFSSVTAYVMKRTPSLLRRRMKAGAGTPAWDLDFVILVQVLFIAILVVGALDSGRYRWRPLPPWFEGVGIILTTAGMILIAWAMGENPHFETTVRIQTDQKHRVIATGPYRIVRHPGYVAAILVFIGMALMLDSAWALVPAALATVNLVARTAVEDRFLRDKLPGYRAFTLRTRYRLAPGIW
jgi:protein-S-isoprenylcysteine O-methyltransferase Ste14